MELLELFAAGGRRTTIGAAGFIQRRGLRADRTGQTRPGPRERALRSRRPPRRQLSSRDLGLLLVSAHFFSVQSCSKLPSVLSDRMGLGNFLVPWISLDSVRKQFKSTVSNLRKEIHRYSFGSILL